MTKEEYTVKIFEILNGAVTPMSSSRGEKFQDARGHQAVGSTSMDSSTVPNVPAIPPVDTNESGWVKNSKDKRYDLLPFNVLDDVARVFNYGAQKYGDYNWARCDSPRYYFAAALRHASLYQQGYDNDRETGLSHLSHAIASLMICEHLEQHG